MKNKHFIISTFMSVCFLLSAIIMPISTQAVSYSGSGTEANPYLITTAEQFNSIRNNLSANYKLSDTIDLSGYANFTPIGTLDKPFTGSLTCDLGSNNLPLYAINNLKVSIAETAYIAKNKSRWEAGLFGASDGATFTNIVVMNVNVSNAVYGNDTGSVVYGDYKPGMDEMASAALVGIASASTITGCVSTGQINSRTNNCGGLVGRADVGSTITNCYSTVTVKSEGKYSIGGLVGTLKENSSISSSYSTGNVKNTVRVNIGGFVGSATNSTVSNCYSTGNVDGIGYNFICGTDNVTVTDCYATGTVSGSTDVVTMQPARGNSIKNCFILSSVAKNNQTLFSTTDAAGILKAFSNKSEWIITGVNLPQLKNAKTISDFSAYKPGANIGKSVQTSSGSTTATTSVGSGNAVNSSNGEDDNSNSRISSDKQVDLTEFISLAESLPEVGNISESNLDNIVLVKKQFDSLSDSDYAQLDITLISKIESVIAAAQEPLLAFLVRETNNLPESKKLKVSDKEMIIKLKSYYDALTDETKESLSQKLTDKLSSAVEVVNQMDDSASKAAQAQPLSATEWVVIYLLSIIIAGLIAIDIYFSVCIFKKKRFLLSASSKKELENISSGRDSENA